MIMKKSLLVFLATVWMGGIFAQQPDPIQKKFAAEITPETSYEHLSVLVSDEFAGRGTGEEGARISAEYIAEQFQKWGLKAAAGDGTYFQPVKLARASFSVDNFQVNGKNLTSGKDFYFTGSGPETTINARDIVFIGYGISEGAYDDYAGVNIAGKVVLVINEGDPVDAQGNSLITGSKQLSEWTTSRTKRMQAVAAKNPSLILAVSSTVAPMLERAGDRLTRPRIALEENLVAQGGNSLAIANLTVDAADQLLAGAKTSLSALKQQITAAGKPQSKTLKTRVRAKFGSVIEPFADSNVLGMVEGSDKKDEIVVVMGHYDHDGINANGEILRGADDNGSGTVGVLEIARAFSKAKSEGHGPRRSILFIGLCAEEKGLIGSDYYTRYPVYPLANTVAALNMDMIGRIDDKHLMENHNYIHVMGADKLSSELHEINYTANSLYTHMELDTTYNDPNDPQRLYYRSDHYNFAKHGIPSIFYFSGLHPHYHTPEDTIDKIDFEMMAKRARLVFHTAWELANREKRIVVDSNKP